MDGGAPHIPYEIIDSEEALGRFLRSVAATRCVGMDLEADNLHHYKEQLCLIQLHADGRTALIDPLAIRRFGPLLEFLDNPRRELWMHGADFDMSLMLAAFDWLPARILDTQIAAQLVGRRQFGLASLVHHYFGITLSKSSQKEDWSRRPLPPKMCEYAAHDAVVLMPLKDKLLAEIEAAGRREWFEQACAASRRSSLKRPPRDEDNLWRIQGWGGLKGRELAFLRALWFWRDDEARRRDVPTFKVLSNQEILTMACQLNADGHAPVRRKLTHDARDELTRLVDHVVGLPASEWPHRTKTARRRKPEDFERRCDELKARRDEAAARLGIDPTVLASRRTLEMIVMGELADEKPVLLPWQRQALGLDS